MSDGYFIGRGDKTSCGGEVLDGDDRVNMFGLLHAREGDRVSCGANGGIYRIVGGVSFIDSHGKLVAGTLDSFSDCPCRAKLIPSVFTASYRNESTRAMASNEPAQAASSSIAERTGTPSSIPSPAYRPLNAVSQLEPQEPGFYVVPQSTTREALEADLFPIRNAAVMSKFRALNPYVAEVKAGSMMVLSDPNNTTCSYQEAQLMQAANQVNSALEPLTSEEANFLFSRAAKYMNTGGFVAIGIGGISSLLAIQQVCNGDSGAGCRKIKFTEGGKFGGSAVGGLFAGEVAKLASARICIALGISTGIGGVMCAATIIGVGAWAGATSGGMLGEGTGEVIYERISR